MMFLVKEANKAERTTLSHARYLMCVKEGRWLSPEEQVDHVDDDKLNDSLDNLQILSRAENIKKGKKRTMVKLSCAECGEGFERRKGADPKAKGYKQAFCSRRCLGKSWQKQTSSR